MPTEPARTSPGRELSVRMSTLRRKDTKPEVLLRRELHARGLRFRLQVKVPGNGRRTIDVAFTRVRLAVFVDGCFWHGCPQHLTVPRSNREWWEWKFARNHERDLDTDRLLQASGWHVLRVWEHEPAHAGADRVESTLRLLPTTGYAPSEPSP